MSVYPHIIILLTRNYWRAKLVWTRRKNARYQNS